MNKVTIDLDGESGNAFVLIGMAMKLGRKLGYTKQQQESLVERLQSGSYENLISEMEDEFNGIIEFENKPIF